MLKRLTWWGLGAVGYYTGFAELVGPNSDSVLMYHSVGEPGRYGNVSVERFRNDLEYLNESCEIVDLPSILYETSKERRVALTFDDGWDDFYQNAFPVLKEFNAPATVFVVSRYLGSEVMMSHGQIADIVDNYDIVTIGNHTRSHPHLSRIGDDEERRRQILGAKTDLEEAFGIDIDRFAYPSGDYDDAAVDVVREGHNIAVSTKPRVMNPQYLPTAEIDPYRLPRIPAHYSPTRVRWEMSDLASRIRTKAWESDLIAR